MTLFYTILQTFGLLANTSLILSELLKLCALVSKSRRIFLDSYRRISQRSVDDKRVLGFLNFSGARVMMKKFGRYPLDIIL